MFCNATLLLIQMICARCQETRLKRLQCNYQMWNEWKYFGWIWLALGIYREIRSELMQWENINITCTHSLSHIFQSNPILYHSHVWMQLRINSMALQSFNIWLNYLQIGQNTPLKQCYTGHFSTITCRAWEPKMSKQMTFFGQSVLSILPTYIIRLSMTR